MSWTMGMTLAGRYRLEAPLGGSSPSAVWSAKQLATGQRVAIQRLPPQPEPLQGQASRVLREVETAAMIEHPHVARCHDVIDQGPEGALLVTELLSGDTLARKLERHPMLSVAQTASLLTPVVSALGTAHARGIVHGLLSASSVFLCDAGAAPAVKVLDFGIAHWLAAAEAAPPSARAPGSGRAPNSARAPAVALRRLSEYAAPELTVAGRAIDHRADVFAVGILLYQCLSGLRPIEFVPGDADWIAGTASFLPIEQRVSGVPSALAELVADMLVTDPEYRTQNLIELFHVLSPLTPSPGPSFGWPGSERRITGLTHRAVPVPVAPPVAPEPPRPRAPAPERRWRAFALGATCVAALELVGLIWLVGEVRDVGVPLNAPRSESLSLRAASPLPALLDDFDDGDGQPGHAAFGVWQSFSMNPAGRALDWTRGEGYRSQYGIELPFLLESLPNGAGPPAAGVRTSASGGVVDLSRHSELAFAHRCSPMPTPGLDCSTPAELVVFVSCRAAGRDAPIVLERRVPLSDAWSSAALALSGFASSDAEIEPGPELAACLSAVGSFGFRVDASRAMPNGGCESGVLRIDDVRFE